MGTPGPHFGGSPFSHDTGVNASIKYFQQDCLAKDNNAIQKMFYDFNLGVAHAILKLGNTISICVHHLNIRDTNFSGVDIYQ